MREDYRTWPKQARRDHRPCPVAAASSPFYGVKVTKCERSDCRVEAAQFLQHQRCREEKDFLDSWILNHDGGFLSDCRGIN